MTKTSKIVASVGGLLVLSVALAYFMVPGLQTRVGGGQGGGGGGKSCTPSDMKVVVQLTKRKDLQVNTAFIKLLDGQSQNLKCQGIGKLQSGSQSWTFVRKSEGQGRYSYLLDDSQGLVLAPGTYSYSMDTDANGTNEITGTVAMSDVQNFQKTSTGTGMVYTWDDLQSPANTSYNFVTTNPADPENFYSNCTVVGVETLAIPQSPPCTFFTAPSYHIVSTTNVTGTVSATIPFNSSGSSAIGRTYPDIDITLP